LCKISNDGNKMRFKIFAPPVAPGDRPIIPYGMAIAYGYIKKKYEIIQLDIDSQIREVNRQSLVPKLILKELYQYERCNRFLNGLAFSKLEKKFAHIIKLLQIKNDEIIFISAHSYHQFLSGLIMAKIIKKQYNNKIVFGGAYFSNANCDYFMKYDFIDIIAIGQIDAVFNEVIEAIINNDRRIILGQKKPTYLLPDYHNINLSKYRIMINGSKQLVMPVQTSQGCPGKCTFCNYEKKMHLFSPDDITDAIRKTVKKHKTRYFYLVNLNINADKTHLMNLCYRLNGLDISWESKCRADGLDNNTLDMLKRAGCYRLEIGLESGSTRVIEKMNKDLDINRVENVLRYAHQIGIQIFLNIIVGFPLETGKDFTDTLNFMRRNAKYIKFFHISRFYLTGNSHIAGNPDNYDISVAGQDFLQILKNQYGFKYKKPVNPLHREEQAMRLLYNLILKHDHNILRAVPFRLFKKLYYDREIFTSPLLYSLLYRLTRFEMR